MANADAVIASQPAAVPNWRPYLFVLIGLAIGSFAPLLARQSQAEGVPSIMIAATRLCLSALILTPLVLRRYSHELRRLTRWDWFLGAAAGVTLARHFVLLFFAFENTTILIAGVLAGSAPLWVALLEVFIFKTRFRRIVWIGLLLAIVGGVLISMPDGEIVLGANPMLGALLALSSAISVSIHLIFARTVRQRLSSLSFSWVIFSFAGLATLIPLVLTRTPITGYSPEAYLWLALLTIGPQLIAQSAFGYSLAYLPAVFISLLGQVVTVGSALLAIVIFNEVPRPLQVAGSVVVIIGVVLAGQRKSNSK